MTVEANWFNKCLKYFVYSICLITLLGLGVERAAAGEPRLGLKGYDPVAYFTMGRPVEGNQQFHYVFDEVRYHFVSAKHLELFLGDPDKYAPRYSGLCTMGLGAKGYKVEANPENWVIHNGQLYLTQRSFGPTVFRKRSIVEYLLVCQRGYSPSVGSRLEPEFRGGRARGDGSV